MAGIYFYLYLKTQIRKDRFIGPALILKFEHTENNLIGYHFFIGGWGAKLFRFSYLQE